MQQDIPEVKPNEKPVRALEVERMHRAYRNHPYVRRNRPVVAQVGLTGDVVQDFYNQIKDFRIPDTLEEQRALKQAVERGLEAFRGLRLDDSKGVPQTVEESEQTVAEGVDAYLKLYEGNLRLVYMWFQKYSQSIPNTSREDLLQVGLSALPRAIEKFDPKKGFKFSTYASGWIRQALQRHIRQTGVYTRLPIGVGDKLRQLDRLHFESYRQLGRSPTRDELLAEGYSTQIIDAWRAERNVVRLDSRLGEDTNTDYYNFFPAPESSFANEIVEERALREDLAQLFDSEFITKRMRLFVGLRFGIQFPDTPDIHNILHEANTSIYETKRGHITQDLLSLDEIGRINGLTRERVRQVIEDAFGIARTTRDLDLLGQKMNMDKHELYALNRHLFGMRVYVEQRSQVQASLGVLQLCYGEKLERIICDLFGADSKEAQAMRIRFDGQAGITSIATVTKQQGFDRRKVLCLQEEVISELASRV